MIELASCQVKGVIRGARHLGWSGNSEQAALVFLSPSEVADVNQRAKGHTWMCCGLRQQWLDTQLAAGAQHDHGRPGGAWEKSIQEQ